MNSAVQNAITLPIYFFKFPTHHLGTTKKDFIRFKSGKHKDYIGKNERHLFAKIYILAQHEIADLRSFIKNVKKRKVEL